MKIIVDAETDRLLGMHVCGDESPEILQVCTSGWSCELMCMFTDGAFVQSIAVICVRDSRWQ